MNGVLYASRHFYLLVSEEWGDDINLAIFYLTTSLYKKTIFNVKKKIENLIKKQMLMMKVNYLLQIKLNK